MGLFGNLKEIAFQTFVRKISEMLAERYQLNKIGQLSGVKFNIEQSEIEFSLDLRGEEKPIDVKAQFRTLPPNEIEISKVTASREWIAILINDLLPAEKKRFAVSAEAVSFLS